MSVPNQTPYNIYTANGLTTVFAYEFYLISASDIQVTINGNEVTSGYTVSGVGNTGGGEVTFLTAPANGATVIFERVTPTYRLTDYQDNGDLLADTVNKDFDRLWMAIQRAFIYLGVALTRPLFGGGPFNANGYRISNLADPVNDQDAATKKYVIDNGNINLSKTLRVPETSIAPVPSIAGRKNKILAFNDQGNPIAVLPESGTAAEVLIILGSSEEGDGASRSALISGGTVQDAINFITPIAYKNLVVNGDWSAALVAADLKARDLGWGLDGQGLEFKIGAEIVLRCGLWRNIRFTPLTGFTGAGPIFVVNMNTGLAIHDSVETIGFKLTGAKILQSTYIGDTSAIFKGVCRYNDNGNLTRTTLTAGVNTATAWIIPVADASIFAAEDSVHIGDGRYKILSISGNNITLYNDGTGATLFDSGTRYQHYTGQYVTKNQGYDNNGIRIGNHTQGWNIKVAGKVEAIGNGWTGFYHDSAEYGGYLEIDGIRASSNGYIGIGLGYANKGYVRNCISEFNGNNGIDIFEVKQTFAVENNLCVGNGVDNIFVGGNGETATVSNNICINAFRIGVLVFGRTTAIYGAELSNNRCLGNKYRSIGLTGVRYGKILGGSVGGAENWSIFIEGRVGLNNPDKIIVKNVDMYQSTMGDVSGNLMNNTGYASGTVDLIDNNTFSRMPTINISNVNYFGCKFYPECYIAGTGAYSAAAGVNIAVSLSVRRPHNSTVTDAASARPITFTISSQSDGSDQSTVNYAVKSLTNAVEILNNATTRGKIIAIPDLGVISYNFRLDAPGTRYIMVECGGFRKVLTLVWT